MPKIPSKQKLHRHTTFLEYIVERLMGPPAYRGADYSTWICPFHADHRPSFSTRPHHEQFKDRWTCFGCGAWGDELDFLKMYFPDEDYNDRLERIASLWKEYQGQIDELEQPDITHIPRGRGSTAGAMILWSLLRAGQIDHDDLLEIVADLNVAHELQMEWRRLGRKGETA